MYAQMKVSGLKALFVKCFMYLRLVFDLVFGRDANSSGMKKVTSDVFSLFGHIILLCYYFSIIYGIGNQLVNIDFLMTLLYSINKQIIKNVLFVGINYFSFS